MRSTHQGHVTLVYNDDMLTFFLCRYEESKLFNCLTDGAISEADIEEMDMIVMQVEKQVKKNPAVCSRQSYGRNWLLHNSFQERWNDGQILHQF